MNASNARTLTTPLIPSHSRSPHDGWPTAFPLRTFLELGAYDTAPGSARGHARNVLAEWRLGELEEAVLAVISELVTSSLAAVATMAGPPPVRLWLLGGAASVIIVVWDAEPEAPQPRAAADWAENGRGLGIVSYFSAQWDYYRPAAPVGGKVARPLSRRLVDLRRLLPVIAGKSLPDQKTLQYSGMKGTTSG